MTAPWDGGFAALVWLGCASCLYFGAGAGTDWKPGYKGWSRMGVVVGWGEPPAGSTVMPMWVAPSRGPSSSWTLAAASEVSMSHAGTAPCAEMNHSSYALPAGAAGMSLTRTAAWLAWPEEATVTAVPAPTLDVEIFASGAAMIASMA